MRLIDADAFYKRYCEMYEDGVDEGEIDRIAYMLSTEPTAYDVENVVSELTKQAFCRFENCENCHTCEPVIDEKKAKEIVRKGGVE